MAGQGHNCTLLYCGDFDPDGTQISDVLHKNLRDVAPALEFEGIEVDVDDITIDRFGLNRDFINRENLTWIDSLITGSGLNLASPSHPNHNRPYVQNWLRDIGERKVEASALVTVPAAARRLCRNAILRYVNTASAAEFLEAEEVQQTAMKDEITRLMLEW
jgi:hypothetical protein